MEIGMTLRQFIEELEQLASTEGDEIEVVAVANDAEPYTPVVSVGPWPDGHRRVCVA